MELLAIVGLLLVSLWMLVYYGKAGWYANIALVNLLFLFGILASLGAVLTLPGIAGIVLTMGTAVDANIIIYERAKGKEQENHLMRLLKSPIVGQERCVLS
jgi:SecD/SecF fusion protein